MDRPLMEFRLDAAPFGPRAPELIRSALERFEAPTTISSIPCVASILTAEGVIHTAATEVIGGDACRHALLMAIMQMLRADDHRILMAVIVGRAGEGRFKVILPCGACRMLLYTYGGVDIRIVHVCSFRPILTIVSLKELLPFPDGGPGILLPCLEDETGDP